MIGLDDNVDSIIDTVKDCMSINDDEKKKSPLRSAIILLIDIIIFCSTSLSLIFGIAFCTVCYMNGIGLGLLRKMVFGTLFFIVSFILTVLISKKNRVLLFLASFIALLSMFWTMIQTIFYSLFCTTQPIGREQLILTGICICIAVAFSLIRNKVD